MRKRTKGKQAIMPAPAMLPQALPAWSPLPGLKYGEAFIPPQTYTQTLPPEEALRAGTIFPELFSPYYG
ncbi:MAG: spore coat associated protein CotJA [Bacillota bacterium]